MASRSQPLAGIRVIDLGQIYQGPYAAFLLAMAGADVVKVEPPGGERLRTRPGKPPFMALAMLNSNKRAVTLDLKQERGRELLVELVKQGDVLIENFAPGVLERLGVGVDVLRAANPRLIYATGSGFGISGPDRDQLAMDHTVQAMGGMMSVTGPVGGPPVRAGGTVGDIAGGTHLYGAIMTALFDRERTGCGATVEIAMQESLYFTFASAYSDYHATAIPPTPQGNGPLGSPLAPYNVYRTKDGYIAIICVTDRHWTRLVEEMGRPDLLDDARFAKGGVRGRHAAEVDEIVSAWAANLTRDEAYQAGRRARVPVAPVRDLVEVMDDPHMRERGMLQRVDHRDLGPVTLPHSPLRFLDTPRLPIKSSPRCGEHNREIYGDWLGLTGDQIDELARDGVI
jgi:crotonobetainyl-CoA:carnitine CoA-transferase CaiB-like acyl-CoA transferase